MAAKCNAIATRLARLSWRLVGVALLLAAALGVTAFAKVALTKGVYGGVITVGRGAAGVRLGMTREEVIARLGRPFSENKNGYMQYAYMPPGYAPPNVEHGLFDVYLRNGRVRMIVIGTHKGFRLRDGNHIFERGAVVRLMHHYGHRLKAMRYHGEPLYRITERYLGKTVWTNIWPERFGPDTKIMGVDILFPSG